MSDLEKKAQGAATTASDGYQAKAADLSGITHNYMAKLAKELEPALNAHVQSMPQETHEDKKEVASWVTKELRRFDLAIKCPKTGHPAILFTIPDYQPGVGRFVVEHKTPEGKRVRAFTPIRVSQLELMEAPTRREGLMEQRERTKGSQTGNSMG